MKSLEAHGDYPDKVYRVLDTVEYAEQFIDGIFRIGSVYHYKNHEDEKRRDKSEGEAHILYKGMNRHSMFASNISYILSCYKSLELAKKSKKGDFIIEINNPKQLAINITTWLEKQDYKVYGGIEGVNVEYSYGEESNNNPTTYELSRLTYSQKPNSFRNDEEFRFVFIRESCKDNFIYIELGETQEFCKII